MQTNELLLRLSGARRSGNGWRAKCPAHEDSNPSLSVADASGQALVFCHAGCNYQEIISKLGFGGTMNPNRSISPKKQLGIICKYDYVDEKGNLLFQTVRLEPKSFKQRRPNGNGGWIWDLKGVKTVLYRLPDIMSADLVYVVEGEQDVDALRSNGLTATCNPMGAGKWRDEYSQYLRDKTVVILPDNDETGKKHAEQVAKSLYGIAKEILIVELPHLPDKGDVSDFFKQGGSVDELQDMVGRAESWRPANVPQAKRKLLDFRPLDELLREPEERTSFLWDDTLPMCGFSICSAKPKVGKSTLARNLAVAVAKGDPLLGRGTTQGRVLYLCLEEKKSEVVRHFKNMSADTKEILIHVGTTPENALEELEVAIEEFKPTLVIIDPLSRVLRVRDFNDYGGMSRGLEPFIDLARRSGVHLIALHHDSKADRKGGDALLGSTALFGSVDTHLQLKKKDSFRTVYSEQRYGVDMPETVLELDTETGILTAKGDLAKMKIEEIEAEIMAALDTEESLTETELKEQVNASSKGLVSKALRSLFDSGRVERSGEGKRNAPYQYSRPIKLIG